MLLLPRARRRLPTYAPAPYPPSHLHASPNGLIIHPATHPLKSPHQKPNSAPLSFSQLKRLSISSVGLHEDASPPRRGNTAKHNRVRMLGLNNFSKVTAKRESLYDKSLRKAHSALRRKDFDVSVNEMAITTTKFMTSKRSLLSQESAHRRLKTEFCQPQSATIIIELKKLFNARGEYSFVHNHYEAGTAADEEKREEQIFSTTHTCNDREANSSVAQSRGRSSKTSKARKPREKEPQDAHNPNELIPWLKDTERALSELEFEPFLPL